MQPSSRKMFFNPNNKKRTIEEIKEESESSQFHNTFRSKDPSKRLDSNFLKNTDSRRKPYNPMSAYHTHNSKDLKSLQRKYTEPRNMFNTMGPANGKLENQIQRRGSLKFQTQNNNNRFQSLSRGPNQLYYQSKSQNQIGDNLEPQFEGIKNRQVAVNRVKVENETSLARNLEAPHEENFPSGNIHITNRVNNYYISMGEKTLKELPNGNDSFSENNSLQNGENKQDITADKQNLQNKDSRRIARLNDSQSSDIISKQFDTKKKSLRTSQIKMKEQSSETHDLQKMAKNQVCFDFNRRTRQIFC